MLHDGIITDETHLTNLLTDRRLFRSFFHDSLFSRPSRSDFSIPMSSRTPMPKTRIQTEIPTQSQTQSYIQSSDAQGFDSPSSVRRIKQSDSQMNTQRFSQYLKENYRPELDRDLDEEFGNNDLEQ